MDSENRLVAVSFDTPEGESPPQTPRRLRPAPLPLQPREPSAVTAHKIAVEDEERRFVHATTWRSCCLTVDKRALLYFGQMGVGIVIIAFCLAMLIKKRKLRNFLTIQPASNIYYWHYASGAQAPRLTGGQ